MRRGGDKIKLKESEIEMAVGHYLNFMHRSLNFAFYKQNVRGFFKEGRFRKDQNPYALTGLPDYVIVYRGFHCGLEVKNEKGVQSESQKKFEGYLQLKGGAKYFVVRSVDETKKAIEALKADVDKIYLGVSSEGRS